MFATSGALDRYCRAERAVAADESVFWIVVDETLDLQVEASAYLAGLRAAGRAFNTEKTYAGRIALYLSYCRGHGVDWSNPSLAQLMAMMRWLVDEPVPSRSRKPGAKVRFRGEGTANAITGTVGEFLSWCCLQGWVPPTVVNTLTQPKWDVSKDHEPSRQIVDLAFVRPMRHSTSMGSMRKRGSDLVILSAPACPPRARSRVPALARRFNPPPHLARLARGLDPTGGLAYRPVVAVPACGLAAMASDVVDAVPPLVEIDYVTATARQTADQVIKQSPKAGAALDAVHLTVTQQDYTVDEEEEEADDVVSGTVHPGAFCSPEGALGRTTAGTLICCSTKAATHARAGAAPDLPTRGRDHIRPEISAKREIAGHRGHPQRRTPLPY